MMNAGMPVRFWINAFNPHKIIPMPVTARMVAPAGHPRPVGTEPTRASGRSAALRPIIQAASPPRKASAEPTDKSMWVRMMMNVMPQARTPMTEACVNTVEIDRAERNGFVAPRDTVSA